MRKHPWVKINEKGGFTSLFLESAKWTCDFLRCLGFLSLKVTGAISSVCRINFCPSSLHRQALWASLAALQLIQPQLLPGPMSLNSLPQLLRLQREITSHYRTGLLWGLSEMMHMRHIVQWTQSSPNNYLLIHFYYSLCHIRHKSFSLAESQEPRNYWQEQSGHKGQTEKEANRIFEVKL